MIDLLPPSIASLAVTPFLQPLPVWDYWVWLLIPLCLGVSIVYKSVRIDSMRRLPFEAVRATVWIVAGMAVAAAALLLLVNALSH